MCLPWLIVRNFWLSRASAVGTTNMSDQSTVFAGKRGRFKQIFWLVHTLWWTLYLPAFMSLSAMWQNMSSHSTVLLEKNADKKICFDQCTTCNELFASNFCGLVTAIFSRSLRAHSQSVHVPRWSDSSQHCCWWNHSFVEMLCTRQTGKESESDD